MRSHTGYENTMKNYEDHMATLGCEATDQLTGLKGWITSVSFDLSGCIQYQLTWLKENDSLAMWIDVGRLKIGKRKVDTPWIRKRDPDPVAGDTGSVLKATK